MSCLHVRSGSLRERTVTHLEVLFQQMHHLNLLHLSVVLVNQMFLDLILDENFKITVGSFLRRRRFKTAKSFAFQIEKPSLDVGARVTNFFQKRGGKKRHRLRPMNEIKYFRQYYD